MDLDRTLFDTASYFERLWLYAAHRYKLDAGEERSKAKLYFDMYGESYDYRLFDHLRESVGTGFDQADFVRGAKQELAGKLLYSDATSDVLGMIHAVLTFGNKEHQSFKLSLCPELSNIDRHIVLEPKGAYIARTFTESTVLVDDKDFSAEILPPARFVRIDRTSEGSGEVEGESAVIHTLRDLPAMMESFASGIDKR